MKIYLVLGCWGRKSGDFNLCNGVKNNILDLSEKTKRNIDIVKHLDSIYNIMKKPIYRNVHTAIFSIKNNFDESGKNVFTDNEMKNIESFCTMHAKCGLYLKLDVRKEDET